MNLIMEESDIDGPPYPKKKKLQNCVLCRNVALNLRFCEEKEYAEFLFSNAVPVTPRPNQKTYHFCQPCTHMLEELKQLRIDLQSIQKKIDDKLKEIKDSISKIQPGPEESPQISFRKIVPKGFPASTIELTMTKPSASNIHTMENEKPTYNQVSYQLPGVNSKVRDPLEKDPLEIVTPKNRFGCFEREIRPRRTKMSDEIVNYEKQSPIMAIGSWGNPIIFHSWPKPSLSFVQISILGIVNAQNRKMRISDLCNFITTNFPFYKNEPEVNMCKSRLQHAVSTADVFQLVNFGSPEDSLMKAKMNYKTCKNIPFWTVVENKLIEHRPQLLHILRSQELTPSVAKPDLLKTFVKKLSATASQVTAVDNNFVHCRPPPFSYRQIIFFALTSHSAPANPSQITEYFKETFPYFSLLKTWEWDFGIFFNLQTEYFTETVDPGGNPRRQAYSINPDKANEIKHSIMVTLKTVEMSGLKLNQFMSKPEHLNDMLAALERNYMTTEIKTENEEFEIKFETF